MFSLIPQWLRSKPKPGPKLEVWGNSFVNPKRSQPVIVQDTPCAPFPAVWKPNTPRKKSSYGSPALEFMKPEYVNGQMGLIIRLLMLGNPITSGGIKARLEREGHKVNDIGHRISDARKALARNGVTLQSEFVTFKGGKRCKNYWLTTKDIEDLAELHRRVNLGK